MKRSGATAMGLRLCEDLLVGPGLESTFNKAHCVGTLGELYRETGQVELALQLFNEMLAHGIELKNPHQQAEALLNIGRTNVMMGRSAEARDCFERALHLASGANVRRLVTEGFRSLAEWFEEHGEFEQALAYQKRFQVLHDELLREELEASGTAREILDEVPAGPCPIAWTISRAQPTKTRSRASPTAATGTSASPGS